MNILFIGGSLNGEIYSASRILKDDVRVGIGDKVEFYRLDPDTETEARHMRAIAHYYKSGESASSLIDFYV